MAGERMRKGKYGHYETIKMKLVYLVDIDVDMLENLCGSHQDEYDGLETYVEDFLDDVQHCEDCNENRGEDAFKKADYVEISKGTLPDDIDVA